MITEYDKEDNLKAQLFQSHRGRTTKNWDCEVCVLPCEYNFRVHCYLGFYGWTLILLTYLKIPVYIYNLADNVVFSFYSPLTNRVGVKQKLRKIHAGAACLLLVCTLYMLSMGVVIIFIIILPSGATGSRLIVLCHVDFFRVGWNCSSCWPAPQNSF